MSTDPLSGYNPVMEVEHYIDGQHNGGVYNSFNHNTYGYCYQNPVLYVDPNGKQNFSDIYGDSEALRTASLQQLQPYTPMTSEVMKDTFTAVKDDVVNTAGPIVRQMPEKMQSVGDGAAVVGYGLTVSGVGAELGVPLAGAGNAISAGGTWLQIGIDFYDGKYSESGSNAAKTILVDAGQKVIGSKIDKIPGVSEVKKEVLKQTVDMTVKAVDKIVAEGSKNKQVNVAKTKTETVNKPGRNRQQFLKNLGRSNN